MVGAFRVEGSKHMTTRTAPGADIEWTRSSSETPMRSAAASQVLPGQVQWPMSGVPAIAQRALAYVRKQMATRRFSDLDPVGADDRASPMRNRRRAVC